MVSSKISKISMKFVQDKVDVSRGRKKAKREEVGLEVPFKNEGVGVDTSVAVGGYGVVDEVNFAERWDGNVCSAKKFLRKVCAIFA